MSWTKSRGTEMEAGQQLLLTGGEVIDPTSGMRGRYDVAFSGDKVSAIEPDIDPSPFEQVQYVEGCLVVPGLVDLHVHLGEGIALGAHPDVVGIERGATTVVDGGSFGAASFQLFERLTNGARTRVFAWLCISTVGQIDTSVGECLFLPWMDPDKAVATAREHPELIVGFKARLSYDAAGSNPIPALKLLLEAGEAASLPVMIHVGNTGCPLGKILELMRPGDVVTHYLTGLRHGILGSAPLEGGRIIPEAFEARRRRVILDVSRGRRNASFPPMQAAVEQGLLPDTIGSDLTKPGAASDPYLGMPMVATQLMSFGVSLEQLLPLMTINPAKAINKEELGRLRVGGISDATVLRIEQGRFDLFDVDGRMRTVEQRLVATGTVRNGQYRPIVGEADGNRE